MAALKALAKAEPAQIVLAVPVAPRDVISHFRTLCDEIVCLSMPEPFYAVGMHYVDFSQTTDEEVIHLLGQARLHALNPADD
jgi:putative phosphoribosyl transferase